RHVVLAVNKMDLVGWSQAAFDDIVREYTEFAAQIGLRDVLAIPISGLRGDNIASKSAASPWYAGPSLIAYLESVPIDEDRVANLPFRMAVQWVNRPDLNFRGFSGIINSGEVRPGMTLAALPSGRRSKLERIVTYDGDLERAVAGQSVTLTLHDEIDISRGDVLAAADDPPQTADQFEVTLVWMADEPLLPGRDYWVKIGTTRLGAKVTRIAYKINVNTLEHLAATTLTLNEIAVCNVALDKSVAFDPYEQNRDLGGFIVIDRVTNATVAAGMIRFALRRSQNIHWQAVQITKQLRAAAKLQKPAVLWFTGLSGAGKSTIANLVEKKLHLHGRHTYLLDGDNVRHGLNRDLGFTDADRVENIRRVAEVARLMADAGLIVIVSFISPFRAERLMARELMPSDEFFEIFIDTPLAVAESRDVKGLYKKARAGVLRHFTGIDSPYEPPEHPEIRIDTTTASPDEAADTIVAELESRGILSWSYDI
ncbi:MAG TPA: adenylyl-sulfate kinase, partial [Candidatus Acidoferrales bacterium]|nr:adenylyl-sulfate kinase [Candidatus Acidoferrales bacterium]